jgi:hypothetical protein
VSSNLAGATWKTTSSMLSHSGVWARGSADRSFAESCRGCFAIGTRSLRVTWACMRNTQPVTNREFTETLGKVLWRPTLFPMPGFMARLAFGVMANELLLASTRVLPRALLDSSYRSTPVPLCPRSWSSPRKRRTRNRRSSSLWIARPEGALACRMERRDDCTVLRRLERKLDSLYARLGRESRPGRDLRSWSEESLGTSRERF